MPVRYRDTSSRFSLSDKDLVPQKSGSYRMSGNAQRTPAAGTGRGFGNPAYGLAGVIRLGYFNVMEEKRQNETSENRKYYQGLPITSMSVALPLLFVFAPFCRGYFLIWLHLLVLAVGVLFITDFRFRKPTNKELAVLVAVVGVAVLRGLLIWKGGRTI